MRSIFGKNSMSAGAIRKTSVLICVHLWTIFFLFAFHAGAQQTRAVWIRPFIGAGAEVRGDERAARRFIADELGRVKRARLDTVFVETFWDGYTIYPSRYAPQRPLSIAHGTARPSAKNFDVLAIYLEEAARLDIKVHAWLHVFHQWNTNLGDLKSSPIFAKNPEWAALDENGSALVRSEAEGARREIFKVFLSPSNPRARRYLENIVGEMAENYPQLAGAQWDYIRYPLHDAGQRFDFSADALRRFKRATGLDARRLRTDAERRRWQDWKTAQITATVERFDRIVRRLRPAWDVSVAVFPDFENTLKVKMQDSRAWARAGRIDSIYPMLYSPRFETVDDWAKEFRREIPRRTRVVPAFFIAHFYDARTKKIDDRYLETATKYGYDGVAFFAAQLLTDDLIERLGKDDKR